MTQEHWIWFAAILTALLVIGYVAVFFVRRRKPSKSASPTQHLVPVDGFQTDPVTKVVLSGEATNGPLAEVEMFTLGSREKLRDCSQPDRLKIFLGPIVQRLPELFSRSKDVFSTAYRVRFSPQVAFDLLTGNARLLQTTSGTLKATAVRASGSPTFLGGGNVVATGANPAAVALIVWQVAAVVTAQKYLADIDRKLAALQSSLSEVLQLLEGQMFGKLSAHVSMLERKHDQIKRCELSEADKTSFAVFFDSLEHDSLATMVAADEQIRLWQNQSVAAAQNSKKEDLFAALDKLSTYSRLWCAASYTRLLGLQVKSLLPYDRQVLRTELQDIQKRSEEFFSQREKFVRELRHKDRSSGKLQRHAIFATKSHREVVKSILRWDNFSRQREETLRSLRSNTEQGFHHLDQQMAKPLDVCIAVNSDGQIDSLQLVDQEDSAAA